MSFELHERVDQSAVKDFREEGVLVVAGLVHPGLADAAAAQTSGLRYFDRPIYLDQTNGQVSKMHEVEPTNTALGAVLHQVELAGAGDKLDIKLGLRAGVHPAVQALELAKAKEPFVHHIGQAGVAALVSLAGGLRLGIGSGREAAESVLEPGTVAFLRDREEPYQIRVGASGAGTALLIAGVDAHPKLRGAGN